MPSAGSSLPEFRDWSIAAVRLLQGVVYSDEARVWDILLRSRTPLENHFARIGLQLVVDEAEGYGYLRQWSEDEWPEGWEPLPKLMRRVSLGYAPTLLAVLLRDELRRFEEEDIHNERCIIESAALFEQWKVFFASQADEVRLQRDLAAALHKLEDLGFVKRFQVSPETWEVRRILKSRLPVEELERLRAQLAESAASGNTNDAEGERDG